MRAAWLVTLAACGHAAATGGATPGTSHATPPTCDAIVAHLAIVFGQHDLAAEDRADLVASCNKDNPPVAERECVMKAETGADVDACGRKLGPAAKHVDAERDGSDPRPDLVELGARVAKYMQAMGEAPPAAGPTPPRDQCGAPDPSLWTGPWQLVQFEVVHPSQYQFQIDPPALGSHAVTVRASACKAGMGSYQLVVTAGARPTLLDVTDASAGP